MCSNVLLFIITSINCFVVQLNSETIEYNNPIILKDEFDLNDHIYGINHQQLELNRVKTIDYQTSIDHHVVAKPHVFTHDINPHKLNYQVLQPAQASVEYTHEHHHYKPSLPSSTDNWLIDLNIYHKDTLKNKDLHEYESKPHHQLDQLKDFLIKQSLVSQPSVIKPHQRLSDLFHSGATIKPLHPHHSLTPDIIDVGSHLDDDNRFDFKKEYKNWEHVYTKYLSSSQPGQCNVDSNDLNEAVLYASERIKLYESQIVRYLITDPRGLNFSQTLAEAALQSKFNEFATEFLAERKCQSKLSIALELAKIPVPTSNTPSGEYCITKEEKNPDFFCDPHLKYRRLDGRCNNLAKPNLGAQFQCHRRLLPPDYGDGISKIRESLSGTPLPSPRVLAEFLQPDIRDVDKKLSLMTMQWGQLIAHDFTKTIQNLGLAIRCCPLIQFGAPPPQPIHPECQPIVDFPLDRFTQMFNQTCINFIRTIACNTCQLGPRDQINAATPVLDLSNLYGGNLPRQFAGSVRTFRQGELRDTRDFSGGNVLPPRQDASEQDPIDLTPCNMLTPQFPCFHSGDGQRVNQHPGINAIQTVTLRRHNQHAYSLSQVNPHWDDETLFQEAKKLLTAEVNRIHYGEYLPAILGKNLMSYFQLDVLKTGYTKYNHEVDPSTIQGFVGGANRFGHSQTASIFNVILKSVRQSYSYLLRDKFFEMSDIWLGSISGIIQGLLDDPSLANDPFEVTDLKQFLFATPNRTGVLDLASIDIQRGRDHGIPGYIHFVHYCTGIEIKTWKDLYELIPMEEVAKMSLIYHDINDIDLVIGGLAEKHLSDSVLGPTFACLTGMQFYHLKFGDRFYFEHGGEVGSFKPDQLDNIRDTVSLANLLCKTVDLESAQVLALLRPSKSNPKVPCYTFPEINYELWRDQHNDHF